MIISRRTLLAAVPGLALWPAAADESLSILKAYERDSGGKIGLHAENVASGKTLGWRADERFVMCSTFKASLAACVLARVDRGVDRLDQALSYGEKDLLGYAPVARENLAKARMSLGQMCQGAVELSDNTCANLLLAHLGGPAALTDFWRSLGDTISRLDHNEPELNNSPPGDPHDTTTPAAMAGNLKRLVLGDTLSPASRRQLTEWMVNCKTGAKRLRGGLPRHWRIGDKTGNNGKDAVSDIAVVWPKPDTPIIVAVYTQGGKPNAAQHEQVFAAIGRMVAERLG
ncbi:MAG: class A beta-lactamase [Afipia sp.]|nr:class A beta-lactamase [Afipia sp.]OJW62907.1 MAG: class A beta-lactamase [Afipia sp. 64-13]